MERPSLMSKLMCKPVLTTKQVLGMQVQFRLLTNPERVEIWRKHTTQDLLSAPEAVAIPTLARAIVSIDGTRLADFGEIDKLKEANPAVSTVELIEKHLSSAEYPFPVINELYMAYQIFVEEFQQTLEELKKNSETTNPEPSGQSVKSST